MFLLGVFGVVLFLLELVENFESSYFFWLVKGLKESNLYMLSKFFNWILYKINFWKFCFFFNKYNFSVNWYE